MQDKSKWIFLRYLRGYSIALCKQPKHTNVHSLKRNTLKQQEILIDAGQQRFTKLKSMPNHIVLIEDDPYIMRAMVMILESESYRVKTYRDDSFLTHLAEEKPGLILMDLLLSGFNGKDICRYLKNHGEYKTIPVVVVSANRDIALHAKEVCADDYLAKPFNMQDLIAVAKKYIL